jgi:hypothetical protein
MRPLHYQVLLIGLVLGTIVLVAEFGSQAQQPRGTAPATAAAKPTSPADLNAEREKIWNSPAMLRARAWLADYCKNSSKVTPELAKHYQTELEHMTPAQLNLWLLRFEHAEEQLQQRQALWQQAHNFSIQQALAANQATQRAYGEISRGETEAALGAQQQLNEEAQFQQNMAESKELGQVGPYGAFGYPGYGGIHYHFHLYPYAY